MINNGRTLFIDFESSYCFLYCLIDGKPVPIRSGYEQKRHNCIFSLDCKRKRFEVITQNMEGNLGVGVFSVSNVLLLAVLKPEDPNCNTIQSLSDVDIKYELANTILVSKFKDEEYEVSCKVLLKELIRKLVFTAEGILKDTINSIVFSTSLELNYVLGERIITLLSDLIHENGIVNTRFISYSQTLFSYFGVPSIPNKRILLIHFDDVQCSFCVQELHNDAYTTVSVLSCIPGGYGEIQNGLLEMIVKLFKEEKGYDIFTEKMKSTPSLYKKKRYALLEEIDRMEVEMRTGELYEIFVGKGKNAISIIVSKTLYSSTKTELTRMCIEKVKLYLKQHNIGLNTIDQVLVEGLCSKDDFFQRELKSVFPNNRCVFDCVPEEIVVSGLCLMNTKPMLRFANKNYGLLISKTDFVLFISKGTSIPCQIRKDFTTNQNNQSEFMVYLVCKDFPDSNDFTIMDTYYFSNLHKAAAFELDFEFVFQIDENGVLSVSCYEQLFETELLSIRCYTLFHFCLQTVKQYAENYSLSDERSGILIIPCCCRLNEV